MFYYKIGSYEDAIVIMHDKDFSEDEFGNITNYLESISENPLYILNASEMVDMLIDFYGFIKVEITADWD